jgi:uncharacterized protein (DUF1778 family)
METQPTGRLEARIPMQLLTLIKRAAEMQGRSLTDYVASTMREAAEETIDRSTILRLSMQDQLHFVEVMLNPPEPSQAWQEAFAARKELFGLE